MSLFSYKKIYFGFKNWNGRFGKFLLILSFVQVEGRNQRSVISIYFWFIALGFLWCFSCSYLNNLLFSYMKFLFFPIFSLANGYSFIKDFTFIFIQNNFFIKKTFQFIRQHQTTIALFLCIFSCTSTCQSKNFLH